MLIELIETTTTDGMTLHGAYHRPAAPPAADLPIDTILLLHGVGSNFYSSPLLDHLAQFFSAHGLTTLRANTRGHDFVSLARTVAGPQRQGAAYESVGQCHYDVHAWSNALSQRGAQRIGIVGHSLGAVKAVYSAALYPHQLTRRVVAMSPPRLSYATFSQGRRKVLFERTMARAQSFLDAGRPETLMRVKYPFPLLITAAGYLEKYGAQEKYNLLQFTHRLPCPALFTFGQEELESGSAAFEGLPAALQNLSSGSWPLQSYTIAGANHLYDGHCGPLATEILKWLTSLPDLPEGGASNESDAKTSRP